MLQDRVVSGGEVCMARNSSLFVGFLKMKYLLKLVFLFWYFCLFFSNLRIILPVLGKQILAPLSLKDIHPWWPGDRQLLVRELKTMGSIVSTLH